MTCPDIAFPASVVNLFVSSSLSLVRKQLSISRANCNELWVMWFFLKTVATYSRIFWCRMQMAWWPYQIQKWILLLSVPSSVEILSIENKKQSAVVRPQCLSIGQWLKLCYMEESSIVWVWTKELSFETIMWKRVCYSHSFNESSIHIPSNPVFNERA